jgi:lipoprotein-releasing system ATP-binding protein
MQEVLKVNSLNKWFREPVDFHVLKDISFSINKGEFVSLIGKSGCGKSTLLYCLSTMDTDFEGKLIIDKENIRNSSKKELARFRNSKIGFVFQFHYLLPEFSALENVMLPALKLNEYSKSIIESRALEKLKLLGVDDVANNPANKLSGGQQQRVAIARALINDPLLIMGDEPTGNLDKANTNKVFDIFKELSENFGQSIISVTHDMDFAKKSDRIIEMEDGIII